MSVRKTVFVLGFVLLAIALIHMFNIPLRPAFNTVLAPLGVDGNRASEALRVTVADALGVSSSEARELRSEVASLRLQQLELERLREQNRQLRAELDFAREADIPTLQADVVNYNPDPTRDLLRLNRGKRDGIEKGMPVVADSALVGVVEDADPRTADVELVTDINFRALARSEQNAEGVIKGQVGGGVELDRLPRNQDLDIGDLVETSGQDGVYPPGLLVGSVRSIARDPGEVFDTAQIEPEVTSRNLHVVTVLQMP